MKSILYNLILIISLIIIVSSHQRISEHNPIISSISYLLEENPEIYNQFLEFSELVKFDPYRTEQSINPLTCELCRTTVNKVANWAELEQKIFNGVKDLFLDLCPKYLNPLKVCEGLFKEQGHIWLTVTWQHYMNPDYLCPALNYCKPVYEKIDLDQLVVDILKDKPKNDQLVPKQKETIKFLQMADNHTDFKYEEGLDSQCPDYICCREGAGKPTSEKNTSKYWGSIGKCDIPTRTFEQFVNFVKKNVYDDIEFSIWTGDNTSHNVWDQSAEQNVSNTIQQTKYIQKTIPDLQVYPIFGNHEGYPVNLYEFFGDEEEYLRTTFGDLWESWIGKEAADMIRDFGYYETVLKDYNLKLITLNSQSCDIMNFDLVHNPTDPGNQLQKLRKSLQESEDNNNQPVYIMHHVPTGNGCMNQWAKVYSAIVDRYSYIIRGIFNAHTHADQFGLFYNDKGEPVNADFIAPSLTTFPNRNPGFRVFEADKETMQIVNIYQYRLDLDYWNQFTDPNTELQWELVYDFLSEYKLDNMWDFNNLSNLREQIGNNLDVYNKYLYNFYSGVYQPSKEINKNHYCNMLSTAEKQSECMGKQYVPVLSELVAGPWFQKIEKDSQFSEKFLGKHE